MSPLSGNQATLNAKVLSAFRQSQKFSRRTSTMLSPQKLSVITAMNGMTLLSSLNLQVSQVKDITTPKSAS